LVGLAQAAGIETDPVDANEGDEFVSPEAISGANTSSIKSNKIKDG
jgi:hypothetical protein